jgi:hypothetical protein
VISLDNIDTTSQWRVEIQEPEMEEAPEWLEEHADDLREEGATEEEEEEDDVPLQWIQRLRRRLDFQWIQCHHRLHGELSLELDLGPLGLGGNTLFLPPHPHHLPPQM